MNHDARIPEESALFVNRPWRTGGSIGRTIYAVMASTNRGLARDDDAYVIGMMDTAELAQAAVDGHNRALDEFDAWGRQERRRAD